MKFLCMLDGSTKYYLHYPATLISPPWCRELQTQVRELELTSPASLRDYLVMCWTWSVCWNTHSARQILILMRLRLSWLQTYKGHSMAGVAKLKRMEIVRVIVHFLSFLQAISQVFVVFCNSRWFYSSEKWTEGEIEPLWNHLCYQWCHSLFMMCYTVVMSSGFGESSRACSGHIIWGLRRYK